MLDIKPVRIGSGNCLEGIIISIADWSKHNYELMFSDSWGFSFTNKNSDSSPFIGNRISASKSIDFNNLERYHGIKYDVFMHQSPDDILRIIKNQLDQSLPSIFLINCFWCPWSGQYNLIDSGRPHAVLVIGYDNKNDKIICSDTTFNQYKAELSLSDFYKGASDMCATLQFVKYAQTPIDWKSIFKNTAAKLEGTSRESNAFECMKRLASEIREKQDLTEEFKDYKGKMWVNPFINVLGEIINGRTNFRKMLEYITRLENLNKFDGILEQMKNVEVTWSSIRGLLIRQYFSPAGFQNMSDKIANNIDEVCTMEQNIIGRLPEYTKDSVKETVYSISGDSQQQKQDSFKELIFIDLKELFNNRCIGDASDSTCTADISGLGYFIHTDDHFKKRIWDVEHMRFKIADTYSKTYDSIVCYGQTIAIPEGKYSSIMLLGTSDLGSFREEMQIVYTDGTLQKILLQLSNMNAEETITGELAAWKCKYGPPDKAWILEGIIYAHEYSVDRNKPIKEIVLPECPNMYIFAISLGKK